MASADPARLVWKTDDKSDEKDVTNSTFWATTHALRSKLVLHRGLHRDQDEDTSRPLENTRGAYLNAIKTGAPYAECDVWVTKDGICVLGHDSTFQAMAADKSCTLATKPIQECSWDELSDLQLADGSTPVKLATVLEDLVGSGLKLVVELKVSTPAAQLGCFLRERSDLLSSVAWVMSFSLQAIELFAQNGGLEIGCQMLWLLDNPSVPYDPLCVNEGETTFDPAAEAFPVFLERVGVKERVEKIRCGLYVQYNPKVTPAHLKAVRSDLSNVCGTSSPFIGLWSDRSLDPDFDCAVVLQDWIETVDALNTDVPTSFWNGWETVQPQMDDPTS